MIKKLEEIVGKKNILTELDSLEPYSHDETSGFFAESCGKVFPKAIVKPNSTLKD